MSNRKLRVAEAGGRVDPDGWGYSATPVQVLNELEYHFGYKVVTSASHGDSWREQTSGGFVVNTE